MESKIIQIDIMQLVIPTISRIFNKLFGGFCVCKSFINSGIHDRVFTREEASRGKKFEEGLYIFGGQSRDEVNLNDLWLIKPEYYTNKRMIDEVKYQYTCKDPELTLNVQQITNFSGQPPCPRFGATMVHINTRKQGH